MGDGEKIKDIKLGGVMDLRGVTGRMGGVEYDQDTMYAIKK